MKNRKIVVIAFMLAAVLTIGIGYAALSTTLSINGTTEVSADAIEFTEDIRFTNAVSNKEAFGTASVGDGQNATFTVDGMTRQNDRVQFTYTILNNSEDDVNITVTTTPTTSDTSGLFTVTTALGASTIAAGQSITATVTVVLNQTVTEVVNPFSWVIEYTATSTT